jgi:DNA-directed RNA polymerase subunit RPC12/RpoP|tara:strand:- start:283 stop:426 length:144 start_codon:yes stop_codon:yes gene_type:complete
MKCWHCKEELIWGGDHDYEDYDMEGDGIVTNLSCDNCGSFVLVYKPN